MAMIPIFKIVGRRSLLSLKPEAMIRLSLGKVLARVSFEKIGNNLKISINGDEIKGIQINDHFRYDSSKVETIEFHDGSTLDISNADQLIQAMNSFSISNSASTDTLSNPTQDVSDMYSLAVSQELTRKAI